VYFFNRTLVAHYSPETDFTPVVSNLDLDMSRPDINDVTVAPDGKLYLATDRGLYIWVGDHVFRHLDRFEGIGTSSIVRTAAIDAVGRVWFSTPDNTGYYLDRQNPEFDVAVVAAPTMMTVPAANGSSTFPGAIPTLREEAGTTSSPTTPESSPEGIGAIVDPILKALHSLLAGLGL
jgi:hypothetical protein